MAKEEEIGWKELLWKPFRQPSFEVRLDNGHTVWRCYQAECENITSASCWVTGCVEMSPTTWRGQLCIAIADPTSAPDIE